MLIERDNIQGIDIEILRAQKVLDTLNWLNVDIYGRMYDTIRDTKKRVEYYTGHNEYKDIFLNDTIGGSIGFIVKNRVESDSRFISDVDIVFTLRLDKISSKTERYDEEVISEAMSILTMNGFEISEIKTGVEDVFLGYNNEKYSHRDMQPNLVFSLSSKIKTQYNKCN